MALTRITTVCRSIMLSGLMATLAACSTFPSADGPVEPGFYRVQRGDTLFRIAARTGQRVSNLVRWNGLADANRIEEGQVLRVAAPGARAAGQPVESAAVTAPAVESQPLTPGTAIPSFNADRELGAGFELQWPAAGTVVSRYDGKSSRGIDVAGQRGDPIVAAHAGRVIHVGPLRGYGNLIIVKLNDQYLTAYAHNDKVLVREQDTVARGQKIAEMGSTDTDRVKLHFELRRDGKPIDPTRFLPSR